MGASHRTRLQRCRATSVGSPQGALLAWIGSAGIGQRPRAPRYVSDSGAKASQDGGVAGNSEKSCRGRGFSLGIESRKKRFEGGCSIPTIGSITEPHTFRVQELTGDRLAPKRAAEFLTQSPRGRTVPDRIG
jgi:hypothetical protein